MCLRGQTACRVCERYWVRVPLGPCAFSSFAQPPAASPLALRTKVASVNTVFLRTAATVFVTRVLFTLSFYLTFSRLLFSKDFHDFFPSRILTFSRLMCYKRGKSTRLCSVFRRIFTEAEELLKEKYKIRNEIL